MPTLNIDQFDESPNVGDKVKVMGKVESIDEDSGEVKVSYDDVSIVKEKDKKRKKRDYNNEDDKMTLDMEYNPNTQSLDEALSNSFPNTQ